MFDYAMFTRLLEIGINPNSKATLYVCDNKGVLKRFTKGHNFNNDYVYTIREIWNSNVLVGKHYKEYVLIH